MSKTSPPTLADKEFGVAFFIGNKRPTKDGIPVPKGYLKMVKVTIEYDLMPDEGDGPSAETVRVDLAEHPLYEELQAYVLGNPRRTRLNPNPRVKGT